MRRLSLWLLASSLWLSGSAESQEAVPDGNNLLEQEQALFRALHDRDRETLERILAEDFVSRGAPDVGRETWIENAIGLCWGESSDIEAFSARPVGETLVASFILTMYQHPETCEDAILRSLVTDVWVRQQGRWRLAVRHSGPVGEAGVGRQFEAVPLPPPRWEVTAELSLVATGGNAEVQTLGTAGELHFRPGDWETALETTFVRSEASGVENARALAIALRQSRTFSERIELFARGGFLQDRFAGIDARFATEGGVAFTLLEGEPHSLKVDAGAGFTREERLTGGDLSFTTASFVTDYAWTFSEGVVLGNETTLTASLERGEDWRFSDLLSLRADVSDLFSVKLSYALKFLNVPVQDFEKTDTVLSAALVATFSRR